MANQYHKDNIVDSDIFARAIFAILENMETSLCRLLIYVNHALVANFLRDKYIFIPIRKNNILPKISGFTVLLAYLNP